MLVHEVGKIGRKYLGKKIKSSLDCIEFKVPFRHLSGDIKSAWTEDPGYYQHTDGD